MKHYIFRVTGCLFAEKEVHVHAASVEEATDYMERVMQIKRTRIISHTEESVSDKEEN